MRRKAKPGKEFWTSERCFITELLNSQEYPEVSIARTRVPPGTTTQRHALSVAEWYVIESGEGRMLLADEPPRVVRAGDVVAIVKDAAQAIQNSTDDDLIFLCICTPRFSQNCYTSLE